MKKFLGLLCVFSVVGCAGNNRVWPGNCYLHQNGLAYSKVHTITDGIVLYDVADTSLDDAEFKFNRRSEYDFLSIYKQKINCSEFQKAEQKTELILIINQKIEKMKDRISYLEDLIYSRTKK